MFQNFKKYKIDVLDFGVELPKFEIEKRHLDRLHLDYSCGDYHFLLALCLEGLDKKVGKNNPKYKEYYTRMKKELGVFKELDFCSYLLITWDITNYCRENDIPMGLGRGSCAGSLVLYLIDVTKIDSLKHELYFERFLSKSRAKITVVNGVKYYDGSLLLDVDLDISFSHRKQLTTWLENKYNGKISKLLTTSTLSTKVLLKEVCKSYLEVDEMTAKQISDMIPKIFGKVKSIEESYEMSKEFKTFYDSNPEVIEIAKNLYELTIHFGVHASAWIITANPIEQSFPLQLTKDREIVTSYSMDDALNLAIKCDILGLRCCSLIDSTCKQVGIKAEDINLEDPIIYDNLQNLQTPHGLFQIEADCNLQVVKEFKPKKLNDLSAVIACARPGALQFVDQYAKYAETGEFQSIHPFFDDIFAETGGLCLYQEQLMKAANKVGFTLEESEILRRIVGKKKLEEVKSWKLKIEDKIKENNLPKEVGDILFRILEDSASYSFNRCIWENEIVELENGVKIKLKDCKIGDSIKSYNPKLLKLEYAKIKNIFYNKKQLYEIKLKNGKVIKTSLEHKFLCENGKMVILKDLIGSKLKILTI